MELKTSVARNSFSCGLIASWSSCRTSSTLTAVGLWAFPKAFPGRDALGWEVFVEGFLGRGVDGCNGRRTSFKDSTVAVVHVAFEPAARSRFADCAESSGRAMTSRHLSIARANRAAKKQ